MKRFHVHAHVDDLQASIAFYSQAVRRRADARRERLRQVDARRPAHQLRDLDARRQARRRPPRLPDRQPPKSSPSSRRARRPPTWRCSTKARRPAATPAARSTGSPTRRASPGSTSTRSTASRLQPGSARACPDKQLVCGNAAPSGKAARGPRKPVSSCLRPGFARGRRVGRRTRRPSPRARAPPMSTFERYLTLWVFLCIVAGILLGQSFPGAVPGHRPPGDREGQPSGRPADLGDDHPDAAEGRLRRVAAGPPALARHRRHALRELGGQAVLDGAARLDLHPPSCSRRGCRPRSSTAISPA